MKKTATFLLSLSLSVLSFAQVQLEQTYNHSGTMTELLEGEFKYFVMDVPLKQCRLYNEDHSIFKTINLSVPSGYYLYDIKFVTRHLFNADDQIELLYVYSKETVMEGETVYLYELKVVDETGSVLLNLTNGGFAEIKEGSDGAKLLAYQYIYYDYYYLVYTNVYSLGGTLKSVNNKKSMNDFSLYPNPAAEFVQVSFDPWTHISKGQLLITDMSGRQVSKMPIPDEQTITNIPTGGIGSGSYVISVLSNDKVVASKKLEIK